MKRVIVKVPAKAIRVVVPDEAWKKMSKKSRIEYLKKHAVESTKDGIVVGIILE